MVSMDLWPLGLNARARTLQTLRIANVGGDQETGKYEALLTHSSTFRGTGTFADPNRPDRKAEVWKRAQVTGFARLRLPVAELVRRALNNALGRGPLPEASPVVGAVPSAEQLQPVVARLHALLLAPAPGDVGWRNARATAEVELLQLYEVGIQ